MFESLYHEACFIGTEARVPSDKTMLIVISAAMINQDARRFGEAFGIRKNATRISTRT